MKNEDFKNRLLATFRVEAEEHFKAISSGLFELEKMPTPDRQQEIVETIFREAHSLKGAARAVSVTAVEKLCQSLETEFASLKRRERNLSKELLELLHEMVDDLGARLSLQAIPARKEPVSAKGQAKNRSLGRSASAAMPPPEPSIKFRENLPSSLPGSVRIATAKLDSIFYKAEELLSLKLTSKQRSDDVQGLSGEFALWKKEWAKLKPSARALQHARTKNGNGSELREGKGRKSADLDHMLTFLDWNSDHLKSLEAKFALIARMSEQDYRTTGKAIDDLLDDMKKVLMLPFSSFLDMFPKLVRDLSRDSGKEATLEVSGADIEIDRRILEEMKDPLTHLIRNCIDHGIESPSVRERRKKTPRGTVALSIGQKNGRNVEIVVSDDGQGIDVAKVRANVLKLGIVGDEELEGMDEPETRALIFRSGVSTSPIITDISGRGLGLAIVQEKVEKLGGTVTAESQAGTGTTFRIVLPLTLSTFRGVLVRIGEHPFVIPTMNVEQVLNIKKEEIKTVENRETLNLNGKAVSLVWLADVLGLPRIRPSPQAENRLNAIVLTGKDGRIAFLVDEILNEQEVLVKSLGRQLSRVRNIMGATVLGSGKVVPILNVPDLLKSAVKVTTPAEQTITPAEEKKKSVLVAEDSITARTLLKSILESAGYSVKTAVDGIDAFTILRTEDFDAVVSDVDMPRMNGLDLTAKIRREKEYSDLPVVLVTALESRDDRERGIEVGANAYIVKSSFDQSNLLEVLRRIV